MNNEIPQTNNKQEPRPISKGVFPVKKKPVTFVSGSVDYGSDKMKEMMLLRALRVTQDPKALMKMTGMKKYADLKRTFDKLSMRKEYNKALSKNGVTFDWIVSNIKKEVEHAEKSSDRLKGLDMLMKSTGVDKYEDTEERTGSWEDEINAVSEANRISGGNFIDDMANDDGDYKVDVPEMPEEMRIKNEQENISVQSVYGFDK